MITTKKINQDKTLQSLLIQIDDCVRGLNDKLAVLIELQESNSKLTRLSRFALPGFPSFKPQNTRAEKTKYQGKEAVEANFPKR